MLNVGQPYRRLKHLPVSQNTVRIYNPKFGAGWTSAKSARKYVNRGLARWEGNVLVFIGEADHRDISAVRSVASKPVHTSGVGFATLQGLAGTPVVANPIRLLTGKRPTELPKDYPDPIVVSHRRLTLGEMAASQVATFRPKNGGGRVKILVRDGIAV